MTDTDIPALLRSARTIAVVGISRDPGKTAHLIPRRMRDLGYRIIPVNPWADRILGERVYRSLADVPDPIDIVNVFRPSEDAAEVVREAVRVGARAVWLQLGIRSDEARRIAEDAGLTYVEDRCIWVEHRAMGVPRIV